MILFKNSENTAHGTSVMGGITIFPETNVYY